MGKESKRVYESSSSSAEREKKKVKKELLKKEGKKPIEGNEKKKESKRVHESSSSSTEREKKKAKKEHKEEKKEILKKEGKKPIEGVELRSSSNKIIPPKFIDWTFFKSDDFPFRAWFEAQKWTEFIKIKTVVYERVVREFYGSIKALGDEKCKVTLKGKSYTITLDDMARAYKVPNKGSKILKKADVRKVEEYNEKKFKRKVTENPNLAENENVSSATLQTNLRIAHKFITHCIAPKAGSFDYVSSLELCLMWHLTHSRKFNVCYLMMGLITSVTKVKGLPYAMLLTPLFQFLKVDLKDEVYVHVGVSEKISKSFVLKTKRVKEKKKREASSSSEQAAESISPFASSGKHQNQSTDSKQIADSNSTPSPKSLLSSESSSLKPKKKTGEKGKEIAKASDSGSETEAEKKQEAKKAKLSTEKGKLVVTEELDLNFTTEHEPSKEISKLAPSISPVKVMSLPQPIPEMVPLLKDWFAQFVKHCQDDFSELLKKVEQQAAASKPTIFQEVEMPAEKSAPEPQLPAKTPQPSASLTHSSPKPTSSKPPPPPKRITRASSVLRTKPVKPGEPGSEDKPEEV